MKKKMEKMRKIACNGYGGAVDWGMNKNEIKDLTASLNYWKNASTNPYGTLDEADVELIKSEIIPSIESKLAKA